jgi:hypothetical protein
MKFAEFSAQVVKDFGSVVSQDLPVFLARLEQEASTVDLSKPGGFGALELQFARSADAAVYRLMSEWMIRTAARTPEICPTCDQALQRVERDVSREVALQTGKLTLRRSVGWCHGCAKWRCPADGALRLEEITGHEDSCTGS